MKGENKMKTVEEIITYLESEIELVREAAREYFKEFSKGDNEFIHRNKCFEMYNTYLNEYIKLREVLRFIKGDEEK